MKRTAVSWVDVGIEVSMYLGAALYFGAQIAKRVRSNKQGDSDPMMFEPSSVLTLTGTRMKKR